MQGIENRTGRLQPELHAPSIPIELLYLWEWYQHLLKGCGEAGITYTLIKDWCELTRRRLYSWEVELLVETAILDRRIALLNRRDELTEERGS